MAMKVFDKVKKKEPMNITKTVKINQTIENDLIEFEKEFPNVDLPKLYRVGIYMAMDAVRNGK